MLFSKQEDARESLVISEKRVRHLEVQIQDEQAASANTRKVHKMHIESVSTVFYAYICLE